MAPVMHEVSKQTTCARAFCVCRDAGADSAFCGTQTTNKVQLYDF